MFNEQYARDISDKIHATVRAKQQAGEFIGAFASYGYRKSPADKNKLVVDEYAAGVVRRIFALYLQGCGKQGIAKRLNEEGILCPTEYKRSGGENYKNFNRLDHTVYWTYSTVNNILHKEIYTGNMVQGTKYQRMRGRPKSLGREQWIVVENTHEAIIDRETWDKAQALLAKRTRDMQPEANRNIFAGYVKCGDCGRSMVKNVRKNPDGSRAYSLHCGTYKRIGKQYCTPHSIPLDALEEIVLADLKRIIKSINGLEGKVRDGLAGFSEGRNTANRAFEADNSDKAYGKGRGKGYAGGYEKGREEEYNKVNLALKHVKKLKKYVYEDYREGLITKEEFLDYREEYAGKEAFYGRRLEALKDQEEEESFGEISGAPWLRRLLETGEAGRLSRDMVAELIGEIKVYEGYRIKISYNFGDEKGIFTSGI